MTLAYLSTGDDLSERSSEHSYFDQRSPDPYELDSDVSNTPYSVRSNVHIVEDHNEAPPGDSLPGPAATAVPCSSGVEPMPSTSQQNTSLTPSLPLDILDALGNSKGKQEVFGPKIQEEVSKRWGRILCEGLNKEQKKELIEKILVPENFQLVKAPKLNPEIAAVLTDSTKNRDKRLEKAQCQLGLGISALTNLTSSLIDRDLDKMDVIKRLSETNQILLDLHFENTLNRRKLITYTLDKKFLDIIQDVQRDALLFGENLSDKIKASKSAEKSGLQIKKTHSLDATTTKKTPGQQGNWRAPPRQSQRGNRRGGARSQPYRSTRKYVPAAERHQEPPKTRSSSRPQPKTQ